MLERRLSDCGLNKAFMCKTAREDSQIYTVDCLVLHTKPWKYTFVVSSVMSC